MARRILNRKDLRADYDAAERRKEETGEVEETEEVEEEASAEEGGEGDEGAPKKKKVKATPKAKAKPRTRTPKVTRKRIVWVVYNNSHNAVATYDFPKKKEAEEHAARLTVDKKQTHFVNPLKQDIVE